MPGTFKNRAICTHCFGTTLLKFLFNFLMGHPRLFSFLQQIPICEKCPYNIWCWDSNPWPLEHQAPPTRPVLLPRFRIFYANFTVIKLSKWEVDSNPFNLYIDRLNCAVALNPVRIHWNTYEPFWRSKIFNLSRFERPFYRQNLPRWRATYVGKSCHKASARVST